MDSDERKKIKDIIMKEIQIEDDMLALYSGIIKTDDFFEKMSEDDKVLAGGIINGLLRDTNHHKETMQKIIEQL